MNNNFNYYNALDIKNFISQNNLNVQKKFGQNFLVNEKTTEKIVEKLEISKNDLVLEIGCGLGSLTNKIIDKCKSLIGFEIDYAFITFLNNQFKDKSNFQLIEGDFLKKSREIIQSIDKKLFNKIIIVGNLPYYITKEIFEYIFTNEIIFDKYCFMIQKEMSEKIYAKPNEEKYAYLSILSQINKEIEVVTHLSRNDFYPAPNVDSISLIFESNTNFSIDNRPLFFKVAKSLFLNRRKTLMNNLKLSPILSENEKNVIEKAIDNLKLNKEIRGESLSLEEIVNLSNEIFLLTNL
ncbi:MAG TPA: 16S rRNA (adenine(1518)-N(6)/adenine(1519)-N(6))-dimethyltransferase RsmA [Spirochaetota bacterium]|nr:16S rRNA (adenine(1518)-N(6)/adenine(1519)-N(6))-dimethyltransferase RsmA [Spirochaetota bacterium]